MLWHASVYQGCILVVEDDTPTREVLRDALLEAGYDVIAAEHGADALGVIDDTRTPDLILLDLNMPHIDGRSFIDCLRARPESLDTPVIVVTGTPNAPLARDGGPVRVVAKPFDMNTLLAVIRLVAPSRSTTSTCAVSTG